MPYCLPHLACSQISACADRALHHACLTLCACSFGSSQVTDIKDFCIVCGSVVKLLEACRQANPSARSPHGRTQGGRRPRRKLVLEKMLGPQPTSIERVPAKSRAAIKRSTAGAISCHQWHPLLAYLRVSALRFAGCTVHLGA